MQFEEAVRRRRMVRKFDAERPIPAGDVRSMLTLAIRAPSAGHTQGWHFLALTDITSRSRYWDATSTGSDDAWLAGMRRAPVLVVCLADREAYLDRYAEPDKGWTDRSTTRWPIPYWHVDVGMAAMTLLLSAADRGLGACFFGVPGAAWDRLRSEFDIEPRLDPVGVVAIGHPAPDESSRPLGRRRRPFDEVVTILGDQPSAP